MKAIILAAGYGRRMRPLTDTQHKTLLCIDGRTIIDRILSGLRVHGVTDVAIVTGYRATELQAHVSANHRDMSLEFIHNPRFDETNNIYSMALAFESLLLNGDVLLIESDLIYDPSVLARLLRSPWENVALVDRFRSGMDGTVVTVNSGGVIDNVIPPSLQSGDFDFNDKYKTLNIYRFSEEFCTTTFRRLLTYYARVIDDNCYYELVLGMLIYMQQAEIHAEVLQGERWSEVDDPNDLRVAELTFNDDARFDLLSESWGGYWSTDILDFAFIRNMHFPPPSMLSELRFHLPELLWNYGSSQRIVDTKLAWALQYPAECTHALAGASQVFPWLRAWFVNHQVLLPRPTFGEYFRTFPHANYYEDKPGIDLAELDRHDSSAQLVVFVNPNNPTGTTLSTQCISDYARRNPLKTVLVDESFIDFSGQPSIIGTIVAERLDNVVVLKSLSKCLGVPGLRLGMLFTINDELGTKIQAETPIWSVNSVAENMVEMMLKHRPALELSYKATVEDRAELLSQLRRLPMVADIPPSGGNFLLVRLRLTAHETSVLARRLAEKYSIYVKDVSNKFSGEQGYLRIAVRTPADHGRLCSALSALAPKRHQRSHGPSDPGSLGG
jgi:histidinol-phosphate/aromatic aminotransferase/cobyric acid decarboxylase-like protein/choline kinase